MTHSPAPGVTHDTVSVAVEFEHVGVHYPGRPHPALLDVTLQITEGDLAVVVGRTGTGKSTLLGAINGLVPHFSGGTLSGTVRVLGRPTSSVRPRDLADVVGRVSQDPLSSFVTDRVEDEVAYGMEQLGLDAPAMRKRVEETLDLMGIADLRRRTLTELSGGQQQRVAIAAVLATQPRVLVLDEPTSALDPTAAHDVLSAIAALVHDVGLTVVLAEHRLERVSQFADQVLWLPGDGTVVAGDPARVLTQADVRPPLSQLSDRLGWRPVALSVREARRRPRPEPVRAPSSAPASVSLPVAVLTRDLRVAYGEHLAVRGVDLTARHGEIVALMGRNGSGKSSLLWALTSLQASRGELLVDGRDPRHGSGRAPVCLVPQTATDLLYLPSVADECRQADRESGVPEGSCRELLDTLGQHLPADADPRDLSEGQRLALALAVQLVAGPDVVLLDEPTRGLDYAAKERLAEVVRRLRDGGACVLVSTHDVEFVAGLCDRVVLLAEGEVIADGPTRAVLTSSPAYAPQVSKVYHPRPVLTVADLPATVGDLA